MLAVDPHRHRRGPSLLSFSQGSLLLSRLPARVVEETADAAVGDPQHLQRSLRSFVLRDSAGITARRSRC